MSFSASFFTFDFLDMILVPVGVIILGVVLGLVAYRRVHTMVSSVRASENTFSGIILQSLGYLPIVWGALMGLNWAVRLVPFSPYVQSRIVNLLFAVFAFTAAVFLQRAICQFINMRMTSDDSPASTSLLLNLVSVSIYIVGIIVVLDEYDISITPIVTALGVGGMAIALGLQETMANIFAGLHILLTKQVRIRDHIRLEGGSEGKIIDITWRYAKIHTVTNNIIIIPNNKLASAIITNYDMASSRSHLGSVMDVAFSVAVGVSYSSDLDAVECITIEVAKDVLAKFDPSLDTSEGSSTTPTVRFHAFGESSIDFNVNLHTTSFRNQYLIRHEFIKALKKRYDQEGIEIPFPIRTIRQS